MKNNWKKKKCFLFFGMILVLTLATSYNFHINERTSAEDIYQNTNINLKTAGYWDLTGSLILIDDSDIEKNWSHTASTNPWCSGSGTLNDPYTIENVTIDGQDADVNCISIKNSKSSYFVIKNCTLINSGGSVDSVGIRLEGVNNGRLINNTIDNCGSGIFLLHNSDWNILLENIAKNNVFGIRLWDECDNNNLTENDAIHNSYSGISLYYECDYNNITRNIIKFNGANNQDDKNGLRLGSSSNNNVIENEITNNMRIGLDILESSVGNFIYNNNVSYSGWGIYLSYHADFNTISQNNVQGNYWYGVFIEDSHPNDNVFQLNIFRDNAKHVFDDQGENFYDNGTIGNFWDNYTGLDSDDNGIGDSPYIITSSPLVQDNYPIWYDSPNIKILSPQPSEIFETTAPTFNVSITDPNLDSMWYTLNNGMQKVLFTTNESINQGLWDALSDGPILITFYANDTAGNVNSSSVTVFRDTSAPNIDINSPIPNEIFFNTAPAFNVEIRDILLNTTWYTVDGGLIRYIFTVNESLNTDAWNNAANGLISITFYANDTLGNLNSASVSVYKDTLTPKIWIISPVTGAEFNATAPDFVIEFDEANLIEMWYTINESLTEYAFTTNGTINQAAWNALPEGELIFRVYIEDIAGRIANDVEYIKKILPTPPDENGDPVEPEIDGYSLFLMITTIWITSTIILALIKKNIKNN